MHNFKKMITGAAAVTLMSVMPSAPSHAVGLTCAQEVAIFCRDWEFLEYSSEQECRQVEYAAWCTDGFATAELDLFIKDED